MDHIEALAAILSSIPAGKTRDEEGWWAALELTATEDSTPEHPDPAHVERACRLYRAAADTLMRGRP